MSHADAHRLLRTAVLGEEHEYDGRQLRSHFALERTGLYGDVAVAFVGSCRVDLGQMVDLEDVRARQPIYSPRMLHVLIEHFGLELREAVGRQRLLVHAARQLLEDETPLRGRVSGDDLYVDERKASVSIATRSPVSALIHFGLNVETEGTPLPTWGLREADLDPGDFAAQLLERYEAEIVDIHRAAAKVRGVP